MFLGDSLTNLVSGLGTDKDKLSHGRFSTPLLGKAELDSMYAGDWIAGTIVDAPCDDMTRAWRSWKAGPNQVTALEREEMRLGVQAKVNRGLKLGRQYGGGAILMGLRGQDPTQALDLNTVTAGSLEFLHTLSRYEIAAGEIERDPLSPYFGEPTVYRLYGNTRDTAVHPSRVIRFTGQAALETGWSLDGWGSSVLARAYSAVRNVASVTGNAASLTYEAKVDVVSIPNLSERAKDPAYVAAMLARFGLANMAKSIQNTLILDENEKWAQKTAAFGGLVDLLSKFLEIAAGAANMPVSRLLGRAPTGLSSNADSEIRQYYDTLKGRQQVELSPAMHRLDEVLIRSALGRRPPKVWPAWNPLWQLTEAEEVELSLKRAQRDEIYAAMGIMAPTALRTAIVGQLQDAGTYPGLEKALEEAIAAGETAAPLIVKAASPTAGTGKPATP